MPGRPEHAEGGARGEPLLHGADRRAGRRERGVPALAAHDGVGIERAPALSAQALQGIEVRAGVHALQLLSRGGTRLAPPNHGSHRGGVEGVEHGGEARRPLGMSGTRIVQAACRVPDDGGRHPGLFKCLLCSSSRIDSIAS